jgi:hypothetical protein
MASPTTGRPGSAWRTTCPAFSRSSSGTSDWLTEPIPTELTVYCKAGFHHYYANHEEGAHFVGRLARELPMAGQPAVVRAPGRP